MAIDTDDFVYGETLGDVNFVNLVKDLDVEDDTQRFRIVTKRTRSIVSIKWTFMKFFCIQ